jgi:hypothetical protein
MGDSGVCVLTEEAKRMAKKKKAKKAKVKAKRKVRVGCSSRTFNVKGDSTAMAFNTKSCKE